MNRGTAAKAGGDRLPQLQWAAAAPLDRIAPLSDG
jgi:hypothetical protein